MRRIKSGAILFAAMLCLNGCNKPQQKAVLLITSDSSVGLRVFAGAGSAEGQILIKNIGNIKAKNVRLNLLDAASHSDVRLLNHSCTNLAPGAFCEYRVIYQTVFTPNQQDSANENYITLLALADNTSDSQAQDSYTLTLQPVSYNSWVSATPFSYIPQKKDVKHVKVANADIWYSDIWRSTNRQQWSMLNPESLYQLFPTYPKETWTLMDSVPVGKKLYAAYNVGKKCVPDNDCSPIFSFIAEYDGARWRTIKSWRENSISKFPLSAIAYDNKKDSLYALFNDKTQKSEKNYGMVFRYDGHYWKDIPLAMGYLKKPYFINGIKFLLGELYATTDQGLVKLDKDDRWQRVGKPDMLPNCDNDWSHPLLPSVGEVIASSTGDLYTLGDHGLMKLAKNGKTWEQLPTPDDSDLELKRFDCSDGPRSYGLWFEDNQLSIMDSAGKPEAYHPETKKWTVMKNPPWVSSRDTSITNKLSNYTKNKALLLEQINKLNLPPDTIEKPLTYYKPDARTNGKWVELISAIPVTKTKLDFSPPHYFANDFLLADKIVYAALGNCYLGDDNEIYDTAIEDISGEDKFSLGSNILLTTNTFSCVSADKQLLPFKGVIRKYDQGSWTDIGAASWQDTTDGAAVALEKINNILYAAYYQKPTINGFGSPPWPRIGIVQYHPTTQTWIAAGSRTLASLISKIANADYTVTLFKVDNILYLKLGLISFDEGDVAGTTDKYYYFYSKPD